MDFQPDRSSGEVRGGRLPFSARLSETQHEKMELISERFPDRRRALEAIIDAYDLTPIENLLPVVQKLKQTLEGALARVRDEASLGLRGLNELLESSQAEALKDGEIHSALQEENRSLKEKFEALSASKEKETAHWESERKELLERIKLRDSEVQMNARTIASLTHTLQEKTLKLESLEGLQTKQRSLEEKCHSLDIQWQKKAIECEEQFLKNAGLRESLERLKEQITQERSLREQAHRSAEEEREALNSRRLAETDRLQATIERLQSTLVSQKK